MKVPMTAELHITCRYEVDLDDYDTDDPMEAAKMDQDSGWLYVLDMPDETEIEWSVLPSGLHSESVTEREIKQYLEEKTAVFIELNDETGEDKYAVVVKEDADFWLAAFDTEEKARAFIEKHGLPCSQKVLDTRNLRK